MSLSITFANNSTRGRLNSFKLVKPSCHCDVWKYFFSCRIVDVWNSLSEAIVKTSSVNSFKNNPYNADLSKFFNCCVMLCNVCMYCMACYWPLALCLLYIKALKH